MFQKFIDPIIAPIIAGEAGRSTSLFSSHYFTSPTSFFVRHSLHNVTLHCRTQEEKTSYCRTHVVGQTKQQTD